MSIYESTELTRKHSLSELIAIYEQAERDIRGAFAQIASARQSLNDAFVSGEHGWISVRQRFGNEMRWDDPDDLMEQVARQVWRAIVDRLELSRILSIKRAKELDKQLQDGDLPPITVENVAAFAEGYAAQLGQMHHEAVREVFDWLRPRDMQGWGRDRYKTNERNKYQVGDKIILERIVETWGLKGHPFRVRYHMNAELLALERVFQALDGEGMVAKGWRSHLETAINESPDGKGSTSYFKFRAFKNGNLHLQITRDDLRARFNAIAGGKNLKPEEAA